MFGYNMCVTFPFFFYSNGIISTFSMACIAVNRFVGIYFSRKMPHWFSAAKSWAMVAGVWLLAYALLALPASGAWGQVGDKDRLLCSDKIQKWAIRWFLGCVNLTVCLPLAAGYEFTQPRAHLIA